VLNTILKVGVIARLLPLLKPRFRGLLISFSVIAIILLAHNEYLIYVQVTEYARHLTLSFYIKWASIGLTVFAYLMTIERGIRVRSKADTEEIIIPLTQGTVPAGEDGYNFARQPRKLQTRGERILSGSRD
jgi:hypothetical protein